MSIFLLEFIEIIESRWFENVIWVMDNSSFNQGKFGKQLWEIKVDYMFFLLFSSNLNQIENFGNNKSEQFIIHISFYLRSDNISKESQIDQEILKKLYEHMKKYVTIALERQDI